MPPTDLTRLARRPLQPDDVWQGGLFRMPSWIMEGPGGKPYRPWTACWVNAVSGVAMPPCISEERGKDPAILLDALVQGAEHRRWGGHRPGTLLVADADVAAFLRSALAGLDMEVEVHEPLDMFDHFIGEMMSAGFSGDDIPSLLDGKKVTVDQVRSFAGAAVQFHRAEPWERLDDSDPIQVKSPLGKKGLSLATIMGSGGEEFGIAFFESREQYDSMMAGEPIGAVIRLQGYWSVTFVPGHDLPIRDHDLWEDHDLPLAGDDLYPLPIGLGPRDRVQRPDSATLSYLEALLRAIADTTEDEMDSGRWKKEVATFIGSTAVELSLSDLLKPPARARRQGEPLATDPRALEAMMAGIHRFAMSQDLGSIEELNAAIGEKFGGKSIDEIPSSATAPLDRAQELAYKAFGAQGRLRLKLARQALAVCPDCADAYVILAERARRPERARELYAQGVAVGERAIVSFDPQRREKVEWADLRCRPYLRARMGLADTLIELEDREGAVAELYELLRLDSEDHQGARDEIVPLLLDLGRDGEAGEVLDHFAGEVSALWPYVRALLAYRANGDCTESAKLAAAAVKANPHMWKYLTGAHELPVDVPSRYGLGSREEAVVYALNLAPVWQATPGAAEWLRSCARAKKPGKSGAPRGKTGTTAGSKPGASVGKSVTSAGKPVAPGGKPAPPPGKPRAGRRR